MLKCSFSNFIEIALQHGYSPTNFLHIFGTSFYTNIPSKMIKKNADIFPSFLHSSFNTSVTKSEFPSVLKQANITPVLKKGKDILKITIDQLVSCLMCLRYLNDACFAK